MIAALIILASTPFEDAAGLTLVKNAEEISIGQVAEGSAADSSGLQAADVLVHIDGKAVAGLDAEKLSDIVQKKGGTVHHIVVKRAGQARLKTLKLKAPLSA